MLYVGSKARLSKYIVPIIQEYIDSNDITTYVEPFVGGANIIDKINCERKIGCDINRYLIALLKHMQAGGALPKNVTYEQYTQIRQDKDSYEDWLVGCAGFLATYRSKFFGGYAKDGIDIRGNMHYYYKLRRKNLIEQSKRLGGIKLLHKDYKNIKPHNCMIYCDPPYKGTYAYRTKFDTDEFWSIVRGWSKDNIVLVSESEAPEDFDILWEGSTNPAHSLKHGETVNRKERLYILKEV